MEQCVAATNRIQPSRRATIGGVRLGKLARPFPQLSAISLIQNGIRNPPEPGINSVNHTLLG